MRYEYGVAEAFALSWEQLDEKALAICECTLGVGHPDTIAVRKNYASFLREAYC